MITRLFNIWRYNCVGGKEFSTQTKCIHIYANLIDSWANRPITGIRSNRVGSAKKLAVLYPMDSDELKFTDSNIEKYLEDKITKEIKDPRFDILLATGSERHTMRALTSSSP
jgi:hypothetical protein